MRRPFFFTVASVLLLAACIPKAPAGQTWRLADDFDALDATTWYTGWLSSSGVTKGANGGENACWAKSHLSVADHALHLKLTHTRCMANDGSGWVRDWTGAGVASKYHTPAGQRTVHFAARIRLPRVNGGFADWPNWWANGVDNGSCWPVRGEINIAEGLGVSKLKAVSHFDTTCDSRANTQHLLASANDGQYHVYTADTSPGTLSCASGYTAIRVRYSMDGALKGDDQACVVLNGWYLVLDLTCTNYRGVCVDGSVMDVDYVGVSTP